MFDLFGTNATLNMGQNCILGRAVQTLDNRLAKLERSRNSLTSHAAGKCGQRLVIALLPRSIVRQMADHAFNHERSRFQGTKGMSKTRFVSSSSEQLALPLCRIARLWGAMKHCGTLSEPRRSLDSSADRVIKSWDGASEHATGGRLWDAKRFN